MASQAAEQDHLFKKREWSQKTTLYLSISFWNPLADQELGST